jgi:hypothetical protein
VSAAGNGVATTTLRGVTTHSARRAMAQSSAATSEIRLLSAAYSQITDM